MITRLSPKDLVGKMMGVWFLMQSVSFAVGSELATISDVPKSLSNIQPLSIYAHSFFLYGILSLILAIISFPLVPFLNRLIKAPR